tara:strand:+ start:2573 stop:3457 length:885 start_codon:yes stop_codon:yes gene_type:complete
MSAGAFKRVGLAARPGNVSVRDSLSTVERYLSERKVDVILEDAAQALLEDSGHPTSSRDALGECCDLVIAVGGDGNMLGAARAIAPHGVPILGINRGRLGFLADIHPDEIVGRVGDVLDGNYSVEEHFLLEGWVENGGRTDVFSALNEIVVHTASQPSMIEFDLYIDDTFVYSQYSDGCIVSSPTGSTAYALSAGGPIMVPSLDAIVLVPMFPHTLNSRSLVVGGNSHIRIELGRGTSVTARVGFDSHNECTLVPGQSLNIRKKTEKLKLVHPPGHSFYGVCRSKLDWASRIGE